jgi:hypothetical protein
MDDFFLKGERDPARSSYAEERMEACMLGRNKVDGFFLGSEGDPTRSFCGFEILKSELTGMALWWLFASYIHTMYAN